ncbi:hypothetical protein QLQ12_36530 [Actinoplanes sp. NEAU-A12]|uniref:Phage baseplate protein n=1 Tax=Actinoplanes sandaracinus TaxID=3045177 RepID=A0ABT6WWI6_9ACTN|nr:hypothetical protein [Actinoplanes sandaracinus]MDI6104113.1 hypothetical protein [Actinoplanes sandaracinus]
MSGAADPAIAAGPVCRVPLERTGRRWALIREPAGSDEQAVGGHTTMDAVRLLDRLLVDDPAAAVRPGDAAALTVVERDLLLAAAYQLGWGPRISGAVTCAACGSPFDLDFVLADLAAQVRAATPAGADGVCSLPGGVRFRLPTARDETAVLGLAADDAEQALLARCLISGDPAVDGPLVEAAMEETGAGIDMDLAATCPECGHHAAVRFQMQDYLLGAVRSDWAGLLGDLHRIAIAYGWGLREILSLPRSNRRAFVALLDGEPVPRAAERR